MTEHGVKMNEETGKMGGTRGGKMWKRGKVSPSLGVRQDLRHGAVN